jgi:hypothetical protein
VADIVQLRRTRGWRKPEGVVTVSRPTRWGNPFVIGETHRTPDGEVTPTDRAESVAAFRAWVTRSEDPEARWIRDHVHELAGSTLACWCPQPGPCHAVVLAEMAEAADQVSRPAAGGRAGRPASGGP